MRTSEGQKQTAAVVTMVGLIIERGGRPAKVLIHPDDYAALRDGVDEPITSREVLGVPIELDATCPRGQVLAVAA